MRVVILTVVLATVLGVDAKQSARTKRDNCAGLANGTFVADDDSCSNFFVCSEGEPVQQSCLPGSYFNKTNLYCIPDTNNVCPQPPECSQNGTFSPHPNNCWMFYICYNGTLVEQSCSPGSYFNKTNLYCEPDTDNVCPVAQCTEEGEFIPHPTQCDLFYVCYNGLLVEQTCRNGSYFNKTNLYCTPDSENICWPVTTSTQAPCTCVGGYTNGQLIASPDSCYSYFLCSGGQLLEQNCCYGNYFDNDTKKCELDKDGSCWPGAETTTTAASSRSCPGGYEEGDLVANSDSCHSYFICSQGELTAQSCGAGNYFDTRNKTCVRDENGSCWPTTTSTTTAAPAPCQCAGGYKEGDLVANNYSCHSFFVCSQGELIPQSCGTGNYFDTRTKTCARDENGSCWPTTTSTTTAAPAPCQCAGGYKEGDLVANNYSCHSFFVCSQGELIPQSCGTGNYFDTRTKTCARDENGSCWPTTTSTTTTAPAPWQCAGGYKEGDLVANNYSCHSYFVCIQGELIPQSCGTGYYFDTINKTCARDENGSCWPTTTSTITTAPAPCQCAGGYKEGDLVANNNSCHSFFVCSQGELIPQSCGTGNYFDTSSKTCARDENGSCWPTTTSTTTTVPAPWQCAGGYKEGDLVANNYSCHSYFVCIQGELIPQSCGTGNYFDTKSKTCARDENGSCWPTTTSTTTIVPAPWQCAGGYKEGDLVANNYSCHSYFVCIQGELIPQSCGTGNYFDTKSKTCARDENGSCWPTTTSTTTTVPVPWQCAGGYKEGDLVANSGNCSSYFICSQGKLVEQNCGSGNYFNATSKNCIHDVNGICSPTTGKPSSCSGRYEDGELIPYPCSCFKFYICFNGELLEESCHQGNYFDPILKSCVVDETGVCWPNISTPSTASTSKTTESTLTPSTASNSSITPSSTTTSSTEPSTATPSTTNSTTTSSSESTTTPSPTPDVPFSCAGGYKDGELIPYPCSCFKFYICFNGELLEESCHQGNYFDPISKSCVVDETGVCWPNISTPSTASTSKTTESTLTPSTASNSSITPSSTTPSSTEPSTATPSTTKSTTTFSSESTTTPSPTPDVPCSCAGGYKDGELIPYPRSCFKFYICYKGELVEESCHQGNYFDPISKSCIVDETGVCWPNISTPSTSSTSKTTESTLTPSTASNSSITPSSTTPSSTEPSTATPSTTKSTTTFSSESTTTPSPTPDFPCSCAGGYKDGELIPYPRSCFKFYICYKGELVEESCHQGNYFDPISKSCVVDETGVCWPNISTPSTASTSKTTESTLTPSTASNSSITPSSTTTSSTEPSTATPSTTNSTTTSSSESTTTPSPVPGVPCSCAGGYKDGELIPYPCSCFKFYICFNGELLEESCHQGNYFDPISKSCVVDETGVCWPNISTPSTAPTSKTTESTLTPSTASNSSITPSSTTPSSTEPSTATPSTTKSTTTSPSESSSPTTPSSTTKVPCSSADGYEDGELFPYPSSCFKFYICFNGELVEESCQQGNYFDPISKSCVVDETGVCWPIDSTTSTTTKATPSTTKTFTTTEAPCTCPGGYKDGEFLPNPDSCYLFYVCYQSELVEVSCGFGNYFNTITKSCVLDTTGICWSKTTSTSTTTSTASAPRTCAGGYENGDFVPNPNNCSGFYICYEGELIEMSCGTGNYFDNSTKSCALDKTGICWPKPTSTTTAAPHLCPNGYQNGQLVPNPTVCYLYYICVEGDLIEGNCGTGNYFNNATKACDVDKGGCCWPSLGCPNGLQPGQITANPSACYLYNVCHNGQLVEGNCGTGNYFNSAKNVCETDSSGKCWQSQPPSSGCSNGMEEGQFTPNNSSCYLYNICFKGQILQGTCGTGNYFNRTTKTCETDTSGSCWPLSTPSIPQPPSHGCPNGMEEGQLTANPSSCYLYNICYNGQLLHGTCGTGNYFNSSTNTCNVDTCGCCWPLKPPAVPEPEPCACPNGLQEGQNASHPSSCHLYNICHNGELIEGNCGTGNYFNNVTKICEPDTGGCCWPSNAECPGGYANGDFVPDHSQCDKFFICYQGALVPQDCGVGYLFDSFNNYCTRDINGTCWAVPTPNNTCNGVADGTLIINETYCDKYSVCYNNTKIGQECGIGNYFNRENLTCVRDTCGTCWKKVPNVCANATTGTLVANPSNCQEFYVCYENRAVLQQCKDGNWFNPKQLVCQPDLAATCVNVCQGTKGTLVLPHPKCNQFYLCVNGLTAKVGTCPKGSNFNQTFGICLASTICEADLCAKSEDGVIYPVQGDVASFYVCEKGIPVKHSCPVGASLDPELLICMTDTGRCIGQKNGFAVASYKNPNAYYLCRNNMAIFQQCPSYAIFDEKRNICVQVDRRRLAKNKCAAEPDGTMLPGDACNEYRLCLDGEDIAQNCGAFSSFNKKLGQCTLNLTCFNEVELCAKSSDTESFPDARYDNVFYKCKRGLAVKENCPKNMVYSHDIGYCVPKELAMSSEEIEQLCENAPDNAMAPAMDCRKFYICINNVAVLQQCANDQHFGIMTGTCLPDVERQCWIRSDTLRGSFFIKTVCHEGHVRDHATDCARYEICANGVWTAELCPARHFFDSAGRVCVPGDADQMCPSARSAECSDDIPLRASENACTDYYRCENNHWRAAKCLIGEFFSGKMATCTNDVSGCARSQKIKPVGEKYCVANETRADELNCGLFHVCHEGEWWYRYCEEGNYFNKSLAVCTPNDGTCRSVAVPGPCRNGTVKKSDYDPCIVYHLCVDGNWTTQHCPAEHYFDETRKACMLDDGQRKCQNDIKNASSPCKDGDRRYQSSNCKAFDICSFGNWLSAKCRSQFYFDTSLKICMPNRGECSANGLLRQECVENTSRPSPGNCSEFYYCSRSKWRLESCLEGFQYNATIDKCIPASSGCEIGNTSVLMHDRCDGLRSGSRVAHDFDCKKYYLCVDDLAIEAECSAGRFFDNESKYCELNNGACPLKMATDENVCQDKSNGSHIQNPANCTTFYICTDTLALLSYCPSEQYFNAEIGACQFDTGICNKPRLCDGNASGRLPHETYCNIYYSCVRGMAIPVACEEGHIFDPTTRDCILDTEHRCVDGILVGDEVCAQGDDGRPLVDSDDCTKYVMCTNGLAQTLQCPPRKYFDSNVMKCMPDDGSCPFVNGRDLPHNNTIPPDPMTCIGKHGYLMPDPEHCNEFYVCIYGNLRNESCFDGEFFDLTTFSCSPMVDDEKCPTAGEIATICVNNEEATSFADQTDCRKYYQCNDGELQSKKCRNGESFDTLLGFCRQNDGTCLLENGQRVGACAGKHGKLAADSENCRGYFTCINGQKISEECDHGEYFVKATSRCEKDVNSTCTPIDGELTNATELSCDGLNELIFYPNVIDACRTFFQCVKGKPRVHKCPDDLLFNGKTGICDWKDYVDCIDMSQRYQIDKVCLNAINGTRYGSSEDNCDSYFICNDGKMKTFKCDQGHKYNVHSKKCDLAANVNCTMAAT